MATSKLAPVYDAAMACLSPAQMRAFIYHIVDGKSQNSVACTFGCTQPTIHQALRGKNNKGGAIRTLREHIAKTEGFPLTLLSDPLASDADFVKRLQELRSAEAAAAGPVDLKTWFSRCRSGQEAISLAVLSVIASLVEEDRSTTMEKLSKHLPPALIATAVSGLRQQGYILTDGISIRLVRTPQ